MEAEAALKVALVGAGTVGSQVARLILDQADELAARTGSRLELVGIAVRDASKDRPGLPEELFTEDAMELVTRPGIDIVIELMGGIEPARSLVLAAIGNGAAVITGNKALLSACGGEIFDAAEAKGVDIYFEAAVAGAIPIIRPLRESLVGDEITTIMGIVNGTTNYILDQMTTKGVSYDEALADAQRLGFAEADPTADVEGYDAAAKAAILASLAFHTSVTIDDVYREAMTDVTKHDIQAARDLGCVIKMLAIVELTDGRVNARVHPSLVPLSHPLSNVSGAYNAVFVEARSAGRLMFLGPGAGGAPTASAVAGDLVTVARNRGGKPSAVQLAARERPIADPGETLTSYYLRMQVEDRPGVLAAAAAAFAAHNISVRSVLQGSSQTGEKLAELSMMTHQAQEADMAACLADLRSSEFVAGDVRALRVEGQ